MLSLEDDDWSRLEHAYGPASDIPDLIRQLERETAPRAGYDTEPWYSLWSSLCHQGDAYTASYAAVSHIIRICLSASGPIDLGFFQLPACVEIARSKGRGPAVPLSLSESHRKALRQLHECAFRHADEEWDEAMALSVAAAIAAAKAQNRVAEAVINLDEERMQRIIEGNL
jgi:hypothetical protein